MLTPMTTKSSTSKKINSYTLTLWYLAIPLMLWFSGWVVPAVSIPLIALLAWVVSRQNIVASFHIKPLQLFIALPVAAVLVFSLGIDGHMLQTSDFLARNAIYGDLIHRAWPVQYPDGRYMLYPSHFWLIPALISEHFPSMENLSLQLWCGLGFLLLFLNLQGSLGTKRTLMAFVAMLFVCSLTCAIDNILDIVFHINGIYGFTFIMPNNLSQLFDTFHYYLIASLGLSILVKTQLSWRTFALSSAMLAALHPMCAAAILPWVVWQAWNVWKSFQGKNNSLAGGLLHTFIIPEILIGGFVVFISFVYYMSGNSNHFQLVFYAPHGPGLNSWGVFLYLSGVAINILPLLLAYKIGKFKPLLFLACTLPFIQLFRFGCENGFNEWAFKTVCVWSFLLAYAVAAHIRKRSTQWLLILLLALSFFAIARQLVGVKKIIRSVQTGFRYMPENVLDDNHGSMYNAHKGDYMQHTAPSLKFPVLFREPADASREE